MAKAPESKGLGRWSGVGLVIALLGIAGVVFWTGTRSSSSGRVQATAVCLGCHQASTTMVGDTPGAEEWPRECPKCHAKKLYASYPCPRCSKPLAFKDPKSDKFGQPSQCPFCKRDIRGS